MHATQSFTSSAKAVLVVEDEESVREPIAMGIRDCTPFSPICVANAVEALEVVKTLRPQLIVLDYQLPGMNGLELYEQLQAREHLKDVPVLLMSANLPQQIKASLLVPFIEKPFSLKELLQAITTLLAE